MLTESFLSWIFLISAHLLWLQEAEGCPESCQCDSERVTCSGLTRFPIGLPRSTTYLSITNSNVSAVTRDHLDAMSKLEILILANNRIEWVHSDALVDLQRLYYVSLEGNRLTVIENSTFANMNLVRLYLNNNTNLDTIQANAFDNATVEYLYMANCAINKASLENVLSTLRQSPRTLDISSNSRTLALNPVLFSGSQLQSLVIRDGGLTDVGFLVGVSAAMLDLSDNPLGDRAWHVARYVPTATELVLRNVGLTATSTAEYRTSLLVLDVGRNGIASFSGSHLKPFPGLRTLIIDENSLTSLPRDLSVHVASLSVLDVSGNELTSLEPASLSGLRLLVFSARNNHLRALPAGLGDALRDAVYVDVSGNPFHCNCQIRWLAEWSRHLAADRRSDVTFGRCRTPPEIAGKLIATTDPDEFTCRPPLVLLLVAGGRTLADDLTVECKGKGDPEPALRLYRDRIPLGAAEAPDGSGLGTSLVYHTDDFQCSNVGNYSCTATSEAGTDEDRARIGQHLIETCRQNYTTPNPGTTPTLPEYKTTHSPGGSTSANGSSTAVYWVPVLVVFAILVAVGVVLWMLVWRKRTQGTYSLRRTEGNNNTCATISNVAFAGRLDQSAGNKSNKHVISDDIT